VPAVSPPGEPSSAELHVLLRWLRQTLRARGALDGWIGESPATRRVREQFHAAAAATRARVLVLGPPGSGREDFARAIHYHSASSSPVDRPLIPIPCALVDAEQLQAAVTAIARHKSPRAAEPSLLLLDVDQLAADAQHELAGFLQVPGFDVRTLSTAQASPLQLAERGTFRPDLAYALSTLVVELPALAARRAELPLLVQMLIEEQNAAGGKQLSGCTAEALDRLAAYDWPGDVRQLTQAIKEACATAAGLQLAPGDLPGWLRQAEEAAAHPRRAEERIVLDEFLAEVERELLARALKRARGNKSRAAKLLGISRPRLLRRMEQLRLE
jgi:DNA-binding NtrC family response regulator